MYSTNMIPKKSIKLKARHWQAIIHLSHQITFINLYFTMTSKKTSLSRTAYGPPTNKNASYVGLTISRLRLAKCVIPGNISSIANCLIDNAEQSFQVCEA